MGHSCYRFGYVEDNFTGLMVPWYVASCRNERVKVNLVDRFLMALKLKRSRCGKRGRFFKARENKNES